LNNKKIVKKITLFNKKNKKELFSIISLKNRIKQIQKQKYFYFISMQYKKHQWICKHNKLKPSIFLKK